MQIVQHFHQAVANIVSAKMRSFLAVLGIMVGTASVVALVISGELATQKALEQFKALGTDLLALSMYEKNPSEKKTPANTMSMDEWSMLKYDTKGIIEVAPYTTMYADIEFQGKRLDGSIIGADETLEHVIKIELAEGNFVSFVDTYEKYCVIGNKVREQIREHTLDSPIGKQLWLGRNIYTIIGVAKPWIENSFFNEDVNNSVFVPVRGSSLISTSAKINNVILRIEPKLDIDPLVASIKSYVERHAPELSVFPRSAKQIIKSMKAQGKIFTMLLGLIGGISLLVGGIGVMNVMLVSVVERKREIGIRMAIGAKRRDIQKLFLIESIVLSLFGGLLGVGSGIGVSYVIAYFSGWPFSLYLEPPMIGFGVSVATGIFFGFYPALRASKLDPIETLRSD